MSTSVPSSDSHTPQSYSTSSSDSVGDDATRLKYLDFVQTAVIYVVGFLFNIYDCAKENSGPLRPGVQTVEDAVKTVIGPVYDMFHDIPFELLRFVDRKVDDSIGEVGHLLPSFLKHSSSQARAVTSEVQPADSIDTANSVMPVAEQYAVWAWQTLNRLPLFPQATHVVVSTAAYWAEKYNHAVLGAAEEGYGVSRVLPLIPVERIAEVFDGSSASASTSSPYD